MTNPTRASDVAGQSGQRIKAAPYAAPVERDAAVARQDQHAPEPSLALSPFDKAHGAPWWYSQFNLMLVVFALLGVAALLFVTLAPSPSANPTNAALSDNAALSGSTALSEVTALSESTALSEIKAPWDESQRAQARRDAQEILSNLLDSKKYLEDREVQNWATQEFEFALQAADAGDNFYKQQDFQQALASYQAAVDQLDSLYDRIPDYVNDKINIGQKALEEGKSQLAREAFNSALAIEPDNFAAMRGLSRAKILDQVLLLNQAAQAEQTRFVEQDDLAFLSAAEQKLQEALSLDKQNAEIQVRLATIAELRKDKEYRDAMTNGFTALFAYNFGAASRAFASALTLKPDDETANLAYKQSLASNKTSSLQSLLNRAQSFEGSENWQNALSNYQAVLARDPNQVQAKLGEIRSSARYQLDTQLRNVLSDPLALSKTNINEDAQRVLADAQAIRTKGSKLNGQIAQLEDALALAEQTIKVQIASDEITEVTLSKEGASEIQLGRFSNKNLALKPGRYVLSGARLGFRDVRKEIELVPGKQDLRTFELRCDQPIGMVMQEKPSDPA